MRWAGRRLVRHAAAAVLLGSVAATAHAGQQWNGPFGVGGTWNTYEPVYQWKTWDQARVAANAAGGHLVTTLTAEENGFVNFLTGGDWWLGLTDNDQVSTLDGVQMGGTEAGSGRTSGWWWVTGEPFAFQAFGDGEPNDWASAEDSVHIRGDALWNDHVVGSTLGQGDHTLPYVVERSLNSATPAAPLLIPAGAPQGGLGKLGIREVTANGGIGNQTQAINSVMSGAGTVVDYQASRLNIRDSDGGGRFGGDALFQSDGDQANAGTDTVNDLSLLAQGKVNIETAGVYTFNVNSDDGFVLLFPGRHITAVAGDGATKLAPFAQGTGMGVYGGRGTNDSLGQVYLPAGEHAFVLYYHEGGGGAAVEFSVSAGAKTGFDERTFKLVGSENRDVVRKGGIIANGWNVDVIYDPGNDKAKPANLADSIALMEDYWAGSYTPATMSSAVEQVINLVDPDSSGGGHSFPQTAFPGQVGGTDDNNFAVGAKALLHIADAGVYTFMIQGDDGSRLRLAGSSGWNAFGGANAQPVTALADGLQIGGWGDDAFGQVALAADTDYPLELIWSEIGGGAYVGVWVAYGAYSSFDPDAFQLLGSNIDDVIHVDGIELVPEPSSMALLGLGGLAALLRRRTRRS